MSTRRGSSTTVAKAVPFNAGASGLMSKNAEDAIKEVYGFVAGASRAFTFCQYNGNAGSGRFLEFFSGIASNEAPIRVIGSLDVLTIVARTTSTSATCAIGFYDYSTPTPQLLYSAVLSAQKELVITGTPVFTLPAGGSLAVKIDSGSIAKPHIYFTGQGG